MRVHGFDLLRGACAIVVALYHMLLWSGVAHLHAWGLYGVYGGSNSRLDEIQAAVLREVLDERNRRRLQIARMHATGLKHAHISVPASENDTYVAHLYVIRTKSRESLRRHLADCGVATDFQYPIPDHRQAAYASPPAVPLRP
jgi:dTDP-4-amino-4,6-dideoxygalactose transaminase